MTQHGTDKATVAIFVYPRFKLILYPNLPFVALFYAFSRLLCRLALPIFLKRLLVNGLAKLPARTPLLFASNHSGSFFDAVVIGASIGQPIHTLTRGDVFRKPAAAFWLRQINLIPVFRGSEGRENVKNHDVTIRESHDALKHGDAVVVFSEGICKHEWKLRPLGKGTARMAHEIWYGEGALPDMLVVPTGINYENFRGPGKRVSLNFGDGIKRTDLVTSSSEYEKWLREFNDILTLKMNQVVLTLPEDLSVRERKAALDAYYGADSIPAPGNFLQKGIGAIGRAIHKPLLRFFERKIAGATGRSVFYDSALFGALIYLYPLIVLVISLIVGLFGGLWAGLGTFVLLPVLAWMGSRY